MTLDFLSRPLGPIGAAAIAWAGVAHTVRNSKQQDQMKEWHANLRWAAELCSSDDDRSVEIGIAAMDALDDMPFLSEDENHLIDKILEQAVADPVNYKGSSDWSESVDSRERRKGPMSISTGSEQTASRTRRVSRIALQPTRGQIAAAKLIVKRDREGKGRVEITPRIRELATYELR